MDINNSQVEAIHHKGARVDMEVRVVEAALMVAVEVVAVLTVVIVEEEVVMEEMMVAVVVVVVEGKNLSLIHI